MQIVNFDCAAVIHAILAVFLRGDAAAAAENVRQRQLVIGQHDLDRAHAVVQHLVELCQQCGQTVAGFRARQQDIRVKGHGVGGVALVVDDQLGDVRAVEAAQHLIGHGQLFGGLASLEEVMAAPDHLEAERQVRDRCLELLMAPFDREQQGGVLAVLHDVTEQRKNQELQREFVANVSHELRTPLTNIRSYAETLSDSAGDIPPAMEKKFLGVILGESDRMTHIVQDLLTLSRFDSGRDDLKLARFSFEAAVQDLYNAVYMEAQRHSHTLELELEDGLPEVTADRERTVQVMMNIVSNSIKYTPDGGKIVISAGRTGDRVWMQVDDNGIGIPPEARPRIFERFYRVDKARSRQSGGTGLGLSIAKEIVARHEGVLELVDREGPGLSVRMELKIEGPRHE